MEWKISNQDIELTEKLLLPNGAHFADDAKDVIRCWHSTDVAACPGSGKTTVLLAKLKLLAGRMPLENGAGICVLSHTNVAVDEIKKRLSDCADKLLSYPNYIGTIQSFVDKFVTMPYLRDKAGRNVQVVDNDAYAQHMLSVMQKDWKYRALKIVVQKSFETGNQFTERIAHTKALHIREDGALYVGNQKKPLANAERDSTKQYIQLLDNLLANEGIIRYKDAFAYAEEAVENLSETYTDLFSLRFQYVFIDEYQDCDEVQRRAIDKIFNATKCTVIKIGDSDQAIYNSSEVEAAEWIPQAKSLPITTSCRYSQEIADVISNLRKGKENIVTYTGKTGLKPILLVFDPAKIDGVIDEFINILESNNLHDNKGVYKAIGAVKKESASGLKIGSYWSEFDSSAKRQVGSNYWALVDDVIASLFDGKLYNAERIMRKLVCQVLHYAKVRNPVSGKEFSVTTIKKLFDAEYRDTYRHRVYGLSRMQDVTRETVDCIIRGIINEVLKIIGAQVEDAFECLPSYFLDKEIVNLKEKSEKNVFVDSVRGRRIEFNTIHGVKGETHDATLYLETDRNGASDLNRALPYFGVGKVGKSDLYDYCRKLAYVGMSRPKKLLCVAMQAKTYEKSKGVFNEYWDIVDLRE